MRTKHTFRLPPDLAGKLADYANRKGVTQALVVEAALASHMSPDGADRLEAALARRLDRITRHLERIEVSAVAATHCLRPPGCDPIPSRRRTTDRHPRLAFCGQPAWIFGTRRRCGQRTREPACYPVPAASASLAAFQFHGSSVSSSCRLVRPATIRSSTSVSQASGSTPFNFAV